MGRYINRGDVEAIIGLCVGYAVLVMGPVGLVIGERAIAIALAGIPVVAAIALAVVLVTRAMDARFMRKHGDGHGANID